MISRLDGIDPKQLSQDDNDHDAPARVAIDAAPLRVGEHGGVLRLRAPATGN